MKIDFEEIKRLEKLSALSSSEEKLKSLAEDFNKIAEFVEQVKNADIEQTDIGYQRVLKIDELRADEVVPSMPQSEIVSNAPEKEDGCFVVPKVME